MTPFLKRLTSDIRISNTLSDKSKVKLYSELRILLNAGLDVKAAVELLMNEAEGAEQKLLKNIDQLLISGKSLSMAIRAQTGFSNYEVYSIRIGEETGNLSAVLEQLEIFYNRKVKLKRQLVSALSYPAFVLTLAIGVVYFMLNNIVPMFADIFKRFGGELPPLTKALLKLSQFTRSYAWIVFLVIAAIGIYIYLNRNEVYMRARLAKILLATPLIGTTIRKIYLARFCQVMYLLSSAKVPLTEAISMVEQMIGFYPLEVSMGPIRKQLTNGAALHKTLSQFPIYEKRMVALIKVAEEVNQLDVMFNQVAQQYNDDIDHQTKVVSSVLEPMMIVIIASVVGVILVAMYLPLFKLSTTIS
ncbi:MAG: type II secretion system F family protein [Bacteroidota bacterium]